MKETAYDTSTGRLIPNVDKITNAIRKWFIETNGQMQNMGVRQTGIYQCCFITGRLPEDQNVPLFIHPVVVEHKGMKYLVTDMRMYFSQGTETQQIKNLTEYNFAKSKAVLGALWLANKENEIRVGLRFAADVFSSWLSETISKNYNLDFGDQLHLRILIHFYYLNLFHRQPTVDEETRQGWAVHTIKATKADSKTVFAVFDQLEKMESMEDLCKAAKSVIKNTALFNFNPAVLLTLVRSAWFGNYAKENITVALEFPPVWCAIVYSAISERTYKSSTIYRYVEKLGKRNADEGFVDAYVRMMAEYTDMHDIDGSDPLARLGDF